MTHVLSLGAINKLNGEYVYPKIANKKDKYICPECNKDLILCQGDIRVHHFRHKVDNVNPCHHYSNPTEKQIHKDAKILLKNLLERKIQISFIRNCCCCKKNEEFEIREINETSVIEIEYRFKYNGIKIADVAYIDDGEVLCIFEIYNTHKTFGENRPEPWFEINAETLIKIANDNTLTILKIPCIRCEKCENCIERENKKKIQIKQQTITIFTEKLEKSTTPSQKKKYKGILELLNNDIIINNINDVIDTFNDYRIIIIHPTLNQKITYHLKHNHLYINDDKRDINIYSFKGNYLINDIIKWYNSKTEYFQKCKICNFILQKVCKKSPHLDVRIANNFQKYKINDLLCPNKRCKNSPDYKKCEYCEGTFKIINSGYFRSVGQECDMC
jgi:hypothetical protein